MRGYVRFFLIGLLLIGLFCGGAMAAPSIGPFSPASDPTTITGAEQSFSITVNETCNITWYINGSNVQATAINQTTDTYSNSTASAGVYNVTVIASNVNGTDPKKWTWTVNVSLSIDDFNPADLTPETVEGQSIEFNITTNQEATTIWYIDTIAVDTDSSTTFASYVNNTASVDSYNVTAIVSNVNGTESKTWTWDVSSNDLEIIDYDPADLTPETTTGDSQEFEITTNQVCNITWYINGSIMQAVNNQITNSYTNNTASGGTTYNVTAIAENANGTDQETWMWTVTNASLSITDYNPDDLTPETTVGDSQEFNVTTNQNCNVKWYFNGALVETDSSVSLASYVNTTASVGSYNVTAIAENLNGTDSKTWTWGVRSKTYYSGNRIWEEGMSLTYTWDGESYSGFYYDLDSGLTSETLTIELTDGSRTVGDGNLEYATRPIITDFEHDDWGSYQVIGFMAEKYFAGYTEANTSFVDDDISMMAKGQLSKILMDDDDRVSAYSGSSLLLEDGYALSIVEVDREGDKVFVLLTKDGSEVDDAIVSSDDDYIYEKDMGSVDDVPIIVVHFRDIFSGIETNAVFVEGIFQISDEYEEVESGDNYGEMEVDSVSSTEITMENDGLFSLSRGDIIDIMGELKFEVADSGTLRFAPFVDISKPGTYELRGTVAGDDDMEWTTLNFEGFYYNMDEGIGTESLAVTYTGRTIDDGGLVYTTTADDVSFEYDGASGWDKYNVVGFIGEKYFAGYPSGTFGNSGAISIMSDGQLSKVLIDDDDKVSLYAGSALVLEEGYLLQIVELDRDGSKVFVSLKKDGSEVDEEIVSTDDTYVYEKDLGSSEDVPVIAVHFEEIFSGIETSAVFVEGIFQISDNYLEIESGDTYGEMEVDEISSTKITMVNEDSISLSVGDTVDVMDYGGNEIQFKVADSGTVRYYPFVEVTVKPTESLDIDMPASVKEDETLTITVTSRGAAVRDVTVKFDGDSIGTTSRDGIVTYKPTEAGTFTVAVEKDGYISASGKIEVISPQDETKKMSIVVSPDEVYEGTKVTISTVRSIGGEAIEDAEILYDNNPIGTTSADGTLSYTAKEAGMHKITATRDGFIDAALNLEVLALEADFEFSNLVVSPLEVKAGKDVTITVDVSNDGKAEGEYNVELYINGNVTDSQQIALDVGESTTVEFTHSEDVPGTYEVTIQGLSGTFDVLEKGSSALLYVVGILGVFAVIAAGYMFTAGGWTVEMVTEKVAEFIESIRR